MKKDYSTKVDDYLSVLNVFLEEVSKIDDPYYRIVHHSVEEGIARIVSARNTPEMKGEVLRGLRESIRDMPNVVRLPANSIEVLNKIAEERLGRRIDMRVLK